MFKPASGRRDLLKQALAAGAVATAGQGAFAAETAADNRVLRVAPQADLKILDPFWTTSGTTSNHALMVYDALFGVDENQVPQPQMVDTYTVSDDRLVYRFKLRPGLKFSDGAPVTARDAVSSIKRWASHTAEGQIILSRLERFEVNAADTFTIVLTKPCDFMIASFAGTGLMSLYVLRHQEAEGDPKAQIAEVVGSGPFIFVRDEWVAGSKVVYRRNPDYLPRNEPPSGLAGGKVVKVDRVEWHYIPDNTTAVSALRTGEIDIVEFIDTDLVPLFANNPSVALRVVDPTGYQAYLRPNALHPPFDKPEGRQALLYMADQHEYLAAMVGDDRFERECPSPLMCKGPIPFPAKLAVQPDLNKAKALLEKAGYDGRPIVIMSASDQQLSNAAASITADRLSRIGCKVDLQSMDYATLSVRRASKADPATDRSGWHLYHTYRTYLAAANPIMNNAMSTTCGPDGYYGWPCDAELERLRLGFLEISSPESLRQASEALMRRFFEVVPYVPLGEFTRPAGVRSNVHGLLSSPLLAMWNIEKVGT
jgi:peptide/nickel transport system substrate-binding protein